MGEGKRMKILVEIPLEDFNAIRFHYAEEFGVEFVQEVFDRIVVGEEIIDRDFSAIKRKCIVCPHCATCDISENPTNGDVIKAMFPNMNIQERNNVTLDIRRQTIEFTGMALKEWWNAPYKPESEDK